jgi:hypothetical protein
MRLLTVRLLMVAAFVFLPSSVLVAQRPSSSEAEVLLRTRPDLVAQLRQRIGTSGLTPDQIRARLRAEGYPETLLDAYLPGGSGAPGDSVPSEETFAAVRALGISDSTDVLFPEDSLECPEPGDTLRFGQDSLERGARGRELTALRTRCAERDSLDIDDERLDAAERTRRNARANQRDRRPPPTAASRCTGCRCSAGTRRSSSPTWPVPSMPATCWGPATGSCSSSRATWSWRTSSMSRARGSS